MWRHDAFLKETRCILKGDTPEVSAHLNFQVGNVCMCVYMYMYVCMLGSGSDYRVIIIHTALGKLA